jgi:hypothetical protein
MAECILRKTWAFHYERSPCNSEPIPLGNLLTGELCAGEPHAQFGGRGGRESFPTPIFGTFFPYNFEWRMTGFCGAGDCQIYTNSYSILHVLLAVSSKIISYSPRF